MFRAFELSPRSEPAILTKGRLIRSFPSCGFGVTLDRFSDDGFVATLALIIAKLSTQPAASEVRPIFASPHQWFQDARETIHPEKVIEYLMSFIRAAGEPGKDIRVITKRTREEAVCEDGQLPWRRSPLWLMARVSMQLACNDSQTPNGPHLLVYKTFMIFFMGHILRMCHNHDIESDLLVVMTAKISRRLLKIGSEAEQPCIESVRSLLLKTHHP